MSRPEPATTATSTGDWWPVLGRLLVAVLITFTGFGAVVPVLPRYVLKELHGSPFVVGATFAVTGLVALLARPYVGQLAQRWGSRRVMLVGAALACAVGMLYAVPLGIAGLLAARLLMGVAESAVFTAGAVWTVAVAPADRRGQLVGWYGLAMWGGWTLGPLAGVTLWDAGGYALVWVVAVLAPLLAIAVLLSLPAQQPGGAAVSSRLVPRAVLLPGSALALAAYGYAALTGFVVLHLAARGVGNGAAMLSLFGAAYVGVRLVAGRLPDRLGPGPVVLWCGVGEAAGLLLLTTAGSWWQAAVGAVVMGGGFTLLYPALALLVIRRCPPTEQGAALGAFTSFWDLGLGVSGLVAGTVAQLGHAWVFGLGVVLALGAGALGVLTGSRPAGVDGEPDPA